MYTSQPSYWEQTTFLSNIDIAVIGAGLVGTSAAIYLKKKYPNAKIVVFDRAFIGSGASTKNAGFACFGSISEILDDLDSMPHDAVFSLIAKRYAGMMHLLEMCGEVDLNYEQKGGYEVFNEGDTTFSKKCIDKIDFFNDNVRNITGLDRTYQVRKEKMATDRLSGLTSCIENKAEGQLHPGKMMQRLYVIASDLEVLFYSGIGIKNFNETSTSIELQLENSWTVEANKLLIANNGFANKLIPELEIETVRNQVLLTSPIPNLSLSGAFHMHKGYVYFRDIDSRVLIGGARHLDLEGETTDTFGSNTLIEKSLIKVLEDIVLKNTAYDIEYKWSGILGVGRKKSPIMKKHSENVYLAVRLGGMGVALGSLLGKEVAELI